LLGETQNKTVTSWPTEREYEGKKEIISKEKEMMYRKGFGPKSLEAKQAK